MSTPQPKHSHSCEQMFLVDRTGGHNALVLDECIAELERAADVLNGKPGDPGFMTPIAKRIAAVCAKHEATLKDAYAYTEGEDFRNQQQVELIRDIVNFRPGDKGKLYTVAERVAAVIAELESRLAKATLTIEAIGRKG